MGARGLIKFPVPTAIMDAPAIKNSRASAAVINCAVVIVRSVVSLVYAEDMSSCRVDHRIGGVIVDRSINKHLLGDLLGERVEEAQILRWSAVRIICKVKTVNIRAYR